MRLTILYIDPGMGSYIIQGIIAGALGLIFYFKTARQRIKHFFKRKTNNSPKESSNDG
jgi:hypothetical protein